MVLRMSIGIDCAVPRHGINFGLSIYVPPALFYPL